MNRTALLLLPLSLLLNACTGGISDQRPEPVRKSEYYLQSGVRAFENSDYVEATDFLTKALAHYRSIDDTEGVLLSHINLTETALAAGNFEAADVHSDAAERLVDKERYPVLAQRIALLQAQTAWRRKQPERTMELLGPLLPEFDQDQRTTQTPNLVTLAAAILRTDIAFARETVEQQRIWLQRLSLMAPATEGNTTLHRARLLRFEAHLALHQDEPEQALQLLSESLALYHEAAARPAIAATLTESGKILMTLQRWDEAEAQLQRALYIRLWIMDRHGSRDIMELLHAIYLESGEQDKAKQISEEMQRVSAQMRTE